MEIIKKKVAVDRSLGSETMQLMLEGEMIVPDKQCDMLHIISSNASCFVRCGEISGDRATFNGSAEISILYLGMNKEACGMSCSAAINDIITVEGMTDKSTVQLSCNVIKLECTALNERKAAYRLLAEVCCRAYDTYCGDVVERIDGLDADNMFTHDIEYTNLVSKHPEHITVRDQLKISKEMPNIDNIAEAFAQPTNISAVCKNGGVGITGDLKLTFLYNASEGGDPLEAFTAEIPVNGSVDVDEADEDMMCCPDIRVEKFYYSVLSDEDGEARVIDAECELCIYPNVFENRTETVLEDAYCLDRTLELKCENVGAFRAVCRNNCQCPVKQPIETDGADMLQIYCVTGDVTVDDVRVMKDKTLAEGVLSVNVLYVTGNDDDPVCSFGGDIPFSHMLETAGTNECMNAVVNASVQHIGFNMLSRNEVEIRGMLALDCLVTENTAFTFVTDVTERPMPDGYLESLPSAVVYIVKSGDTLWKLAKRFNTTVSGIAGLNGIDDPDLIFPGQQLIILKGAV